MTPHQRQIIEVLVDGGNISTSKHGARLRDKDLNPIIKINAKTYYRIHRDLLRKDERDLFVLDPEKVKKIHGNSLIKKLYLKKLTA